jgi:hypothetical protein
MPPFPAALHYLWRTYLRLRQRTAPGFSGASPVSWQDIDAFVRRSGIVLAPWEVEVVEALDNAFMQPDPRQPTVPEGGARAVVSPDDIEGVKKLMGSIGRRRTVIRKGK